MKHHYRLVGTVVMLFLLNAIVIGVSPISAQAQGIVRTSYHAATGMVRFIGADINNPVTIAGVTGANLTTEANANAILSVYAPQFGVVNPAQDLQFIKEYAAEAHTVIRRYQQVVQGIPVFGGELVLTMTPSGGMVALTGEIGTNLAVPTVATVTKQQAAAAAVQQVAADYGLNPADLALNGKPLLTIFDPRLVNSSDLRTAELVWSAEVVSLTGQPVRTLVLVNALTGATSLRYTLLETEPARVKSLGQLALPSATQPTILKSEVEIIEPRTGGQPDMATYDLNHAEAGNGTLLCDETDLTCTEGALPDADSAHTFAYQTYMMYWNWHARDSINGTGLLLKSRVRFSSDYCNAYWDGTQMTYGDGCATSIVRDDVVAHELTHGVTEYTSGLQYFAEPGGINESFSDVWGEYLDLTNGTIEDTPENRWVIGEEISAGGFRNMKNPPSKYDPDRIRSPFYFSYPADNQGVHINSGINNKAAYLIADGDTFNGQTITGIGIRKAAAIYFRVQTTKLSVLSDYLDLGDALNQSCTELIGTVIDGSAITADDCTQVQKTVLATEMNLTASPNAPTAEFCPGGSAQNVFFDNLESGGANWAASNLVGSNTWNLQSTSPKINGSFSIHGGDPSSVSDSVVAMVNSVSIPADAYLHFVHKFVFEGDSSGGWDGGILEYSTNGGSSWTQVVSEYEDGQPYIWTMPGAYGNPLAGKIAFAFSSRGSIAASTRYNLSGLAGQNVQFRFRIGSDNVGSATGWTIDDIRVYTCIPAATTELVLNGGMETDVDTNKIPDGWTGKNLLGDKQKCDTDIKTYAHTGDCAFVFKGGVAESSSVTQIIDISGVTFVTGDSLDLSTFIQATNAAASGKIKVNIAYSDGTTTGKLTVSFGTNATYAEVTGNYTLTSAAVSKIKLQILNKSTAGKVNLDDVSLLLTSTATAGVSAKTDVIPLPESSIGGRSK